MRKQPNEKWAKDLNRHVTKENLWKGNEHMKRRSTPLATREMEMKTMLRYYDRPNRFVTTEKD